MSKSNIKSLLRKLNIDEAFDFYLKFIFNSEKLSLLESHGFSIVGSVSSTDWELFSSILVGENASEGYGADLRNFEVKSAKIKSSFEYQYHKNTGLKKLKEDMNVNHLFLSYSERYDELIVRVIEARSISGMFGKWEELLRENYKSGSARQRFRKSISYGFVEKNGHIVLHVKNGSL